MILLAKVIVFAALATVSGIVLLVPSILLTAMWLIVSGILHRLGVRCYV